VRILQSAGERVEVQNYIDNTGVQVADVVVGFMHIEKMSLDDIKALDTSLPQSVLLITYCWDLYTKVGLFYRDGEASGELNAERLKLRTDVLHALEEGNNQLPNSPTMLPREMCNASSTPWSDSAFATTCWRASRRFCICIFGIVRLS